MTENKQYRLNKWGTRLLKNNRPLFDWANESDNIVDLINEQDKRIKELEKENENQSNILEDFMLMLNKLQANPNNEILQSMAKDMLRMMGKDIMGDVK